MKLWHECSRVGNRMEFSSMPKRYDDVCHTLCGNVQVNMVWYKYAQRHARFAIQSLNIRLISFGKYKSFNVSFGFRANITCMSVAKVYVWSDEMATQPSYRNVKRRDCRCRIINHVKVWRTVWWSFFISHSFLDKHFFSLCCCKFFFATNVNCVYVPILERI